MAALLIVPRRMSTFSFMTSSLGHGEGDVRLELVVPRDVLHLLAVDPSLGIDRIHVHLEPVEVVGAHGSGASGVGVDDAYLDGMGGLGSLRSLL